MASYNKNIEGQFVGEEGSPMYTEIDSDISWWEWLKKLLGLEK